MKPHFRIVVLLPGAGASLALVPGCGRNDAGMVLAPTGVRPGPGEWLASVTGIIYFDPANTPDLAAPPYPPTRVELFSGGTLAAVDSLEPGSRSFLFPHVAPGDYSLVVRSRVFFAKSRAGITVREAPLDIGNVTLTLNPLALENAIYVAGGIPGLGADQIPFATGILEGSGFGVWTYPNLFWDPVQIPAGTYRFKFATDESSTDEDLIGWGGNSADTLQVPLTDQLTTEGRGPATDLVVRFPVTGFYAFTLDERRQRFSISLVPPAPGAGPGR